MYCTDEDVLTWEHLYVKVLAKTSKFSVTGDQLRLKTSENSEMIFKAGQ